MGDHADDAIDDAIENMLRDEDDGPELESDVAPWRPPWRRQREISDAESI